MSDLRLFLLLGGIFLIAGIYLWAVFQSRQQKRQQTLRDFPGAEHPAEVRLNSEPDASIDYSSALAGLSRSMSGAKKESIEAELKVKDDADVGGDEFNTQVPTEPLEKPGMEEPRPVAPETEGRSGEAAEVSQIIAFNIIPRAKDYIEGEAIARALDEVDMQLGEMEIFHHYGMGDMKMDKPLFSLANILEPGSFVMDEIRELRTPGLVIFMCIPTPIDSEVVFELMLNTAQRLAEHLGADVCDAKRELLNEAGIDSIRQGLLETRRQ